MSRYIHGLKRFDWPEIRGPIKTQTEDVRVGEEEGGEGWSLRGWDRVVMVSPSQVGSLPVCRSS